MAELGTQGFNCVKNKIAAFKKQYRRNPTQSEIGAFQTECYKAASNEEKLKIKSRQATLEAEKKNQRY